MFISLTVLMLLLGNRLFRGNSEVGIREEKLESQSKAPAAAGSLIIALGGGCGGAVIAYGITGSAVFALLGLSGGYLAVKWMKEKRERDRLELLSNQYPDVLSQLESATHGSLNLYQALEDVTPNLPRPARDIFYDVLRRVRTGENLAEALEKTINTTGWTDLRNLLLGFKLSNSMGIDFRLICRHALEAHYEKESSRGQVRGAVAQNMMTLKFLSVLPFFVVGAARAIAPDFTAPLFSTFEGNVIFIICVVVILYGNIAAKRMVYRTLKV